MSEPLARLVGVSRRFGSVAALADADLELRPGEVHGVLGANGAGKSTLLGILGGMVRPDGGTVEIAGEEAVLTSPRDAWRRGVALVHQHFTLVPTLSALENLALGRRRRSGLVLDLEGVRADAVALQERTGLRVPLDARVETLGVGDRQRTEILKALLRDPRVLVLDEPTAVLTPHEIDGLFTLLREVAAEGRAVVLVAHKLDEVLGVADRLTVLREGRTVLTIPAAEASVDALVRAMVGEDVDAASPAVDTAALGIDRVAVGWVRAVADPTPPPLEDPDAGSERRLAERARPAARLDDVHVRGPRGEPAVDGVTLTVYRGEIVGVAGVEGNGQDELALVLAGRIPPDDGLAALPAGIGFIPPDRTTAGIVADFDLTENAALAFHRLERFQRGRWLLWDEIARAADELRTRYSVAAPGIHTPVGNLSGGNQQRVVVGREVAMATDLLVAENPTRGLDVAATAFVHDELRRIADLGPEAPGVVLVSTDLDEVLALAHRIVVISRGRLVEVSRERRSREGVGALMLGGADA